MPKCRCCDNRLAVWGPSADFKAVTVKINRGQKDEREIEMTVDDACAFAQSILTAAESCEFHTFRNAQEK